MVGTLRFAHRTLIIFGGHAALCPPYINYLVGWAKRSVPTKNTKKSYPEGPQSLLLF